MKIIKIFLFGFLISIVSSQAAALSNLCEFGGGYSPYWRHYTTYSSDDYIWLFGEGAHEAGYYVFSPVVSFGADALYMTAGGGNKQRIVPITGMFGNWYFEGSSTLGFLTFGTFSPAAPGLLCGQGLDYKEVTTNVTLSQSTVVEGTSVTASWNGVNATYCVADGGVWPGPSNGFTFIATPSDSGTHTVTCYNSNDYDSDNVVLTVNSCPTAPLPATSWSYTLNIGSSPGSGNIGAFTSNGSPIITTQAFCAGDHWRLRVTNLHQNATIHVNLGNLGISQILRDPGSGIDRIPNANCSTLDVMYNTLTHYASQYEITSPMGGWYAREAVIAHEELHGIQYLNNISTLLSPFVTAVETHTDIKIPLAEAATASEARSKLILKPEYTLLTSSFAVSTNSAATVFFHDSSFIAAQQAAISTFITDINARKGALSCP